MNLPPWFSPAARHDARGNHAQRHGRDWITRAELRELQEAERRRERRARFRLLIIVVLSVVFWAVLFLRMCGRKP